MELKDTPPFLRPFTAGKDDLTVGHDELGRPIKKSVVGNEYADKSLSHGKPSLANAKENIKETVSGFKEGLAKLIEDPTTFLDETLGGFVESTLGFKDEVMSGQATLGQVEGLAPVVGGISTPFSVPEGATRVFGGRSAKKFPYEKEFDYYELKDKGLSDEDIWQTLGIEQDEVNKNWSFEINPDYRIKGDSEESTLKFLKIFSDELAPDEVLSVEEPLGKIIDWPELFDNYPRLKETTVLLLPQKDNGYFNAEDNVLAIGKGWFDSKEKLTDILSHELQHGIQSHEENSGGASMDYFWKYDPEVNDLKKQSDYWIGINDEKAEKLYNEAKLLTWSKYQTNYGEVEARATELRNYLTPEERREIPPSDTKKQAYGLFNKERSKSAHMPTARMSHPIDKKGEPMDFLNFAEGGVVPPSEPVNKTNGNEVPLGSSPEEVEDDIPAKLSGGEYVLPADVVQFYGIDKIEKFVQKAKMSLQELETNGRIGGEKGEGTPKEEQAATEEDDLPFDVSALKTSEGMEDPASQPIMMAEGGLVQGATERKPYRDSRGNIQYILFRNGQPVQAIPEGLTPANSASSTNESSDTSAPRDNKPMTNWDASDYESYLKGRTIFGDVSKLATAAIGPAGLLMAGAAKLIDNRTTSRAVENINKMLEKPDLTPQDRAKFEELKTQYMEIKGGDGQSNGTLLGDAKTFTPRDSLAANVGLYGQDKIPFNEGIWSWRENKLKKELEEKKDTELKEKLGVDQMNPSKKKETKEPSMFDDETEQTSRPTVSVKNEPTSNAPVSSPRPQRNPRNDKKDKGKNYAKGGFVKRPNC